MFVIRERVKDIIEALITCTHISEATLKWAESRKEALHSLIMILQTLGVDEAGEFYSYHICLEFRIFLKPKIHFSDKWQLFVPDLYDCYLLALKEYTIDSRGDIGAWVREAAMIGLHVRIPSQKKK